MAQRSQLEVVHRHQGLRSSRYVGRGRLWASCWPHQTRFVHHHRHQPVGFKSLKDRLERGQVRHVIAGAAHAGKFDTLAGNYSRISVGDRVTDCKAIKGLRGRKRHRRLRASTNRCCSTSPPAPPPSRSWCCTPIRAIRSGICRPCTGSGCSPANPSQHHLPEAALHASKCFFTTWTRLLRLFHRRAPCPQL